jgi:putative toxin-antitoxin system antitoxin component (TIGR02293 family)
VAANPLDASEQDIHEFIMAGFSAASVETLCSLGAFSPLARHQIISPNVLSTRLARGQRLSVSDRLFRLVQVMAMAEMLFGDGKKPSAGSANPRCVFRVPPIALLATSQGTRMVEEMLINVAEGLAF